MAKLCPSAQPGMENCKVLGVVQHDGPRPLLLHGNFGSLHGRHTRAAKTPPLFTASVERFVRGRKRTAPLPTTQRRQVCPLIIDAYRALNAQDKAALLAFLNSL